MLIASPRRPLARTYSERTVHSPTEVNELRLKTLEENLMKKEEDAKLAAGTLIFYII